MANENVVLSAQEILVKVSKGELTPEEAAKLIPGAKATKKEKPEFELRVSAKAKCVSVYGKGIRWRGFHFYANELLTILEHAEDCVTFIEAHKGELASKAPDKETGEGETAAPEGEQKAA